MNCILVTTSSCIPTGTPFLTFMALIRTWIYMAGDCRRLLSEGRPAAFRSHLIIYSSRMLGGGGSNILRGGKRSYECKTLVGNFVEEAYRPGAVKDVRDGGVSYSSNTRVQMQQGARIKVPEFGAGFTIQTRRPSSTTMNSLALTRREARRRGSRSRSQRTTTRVSRRSLQPHGS